MRPSPGYKALFSSLLFSSSNDNKREDKRSRREKGSIRERHDSKSYIAIIKILILLNIFIFTVSYDKLYNSSTIILKIQGSNEKKYFVLIIIFFKENIIQQKYI